MSSSVTIRFDINAETLQKAFPTAKSVKMNRSGKTATIEFESAADANAFESVKSFECPVSQKPQIVFTKPDVTANAADATKLVTISDTKTTTGGRIYKNKVDLPTKHTCSLRFEPKVNSIILPQISFNSVQINVLSIIVQPDQQKSGRTSVYIRVFHPTSGRFGTLVFKRHVDPQTNEVRFSRRCFDLLVSEADYKKADDDVIPVQFISVESITIDPETGLWSELKISLDEVSAPLSLFRLGTQKPRQGGFRQGGRPFRGGFRRGSRPTRGSRPFRARNKPAATPAPAQTPQ